MKTPHSTIPPKGAYLSRGRSITYVILVEGIRNIREGVLIEEGAQTRKVKKKLNILDEEEFLEDTLALKEPSVMK